VEVPKNALTPHGWRPQFLPDNYRDQRYFANAKPFALLVILERLPEFTDEHGGKRIAILFMAADGIATYEALFCQNGMQSTPFAVKLQDHGYGGNYDRFGRGGHLERVACHYKIFPSFLLVGDNTDPWAGFSIVPGTGTDIGGYNANHCSLYQQDT
jgi:hypothetical protein